jgi:hypothetical protein
MGKTRGPTIDVPARVAFADRDNVPEVDAQDESKPGPLTQHPERRAAVPWDTAFADDDDFMAAPELASIGNALVARYAEFGFLANTKIEYRWKRKGGRSHGRDTYGKCVKTSGALRHFARCDYLIWVAADHVCESTWTELQLEALLYHELCHCGFEIDDDEKSPTYGEMRLTIRGHDDEVFLDELRRYGAWNSSRERAGEVYAQVRLPEA